MTQLGQTICFHQNSIVTLESGIKEKLKDLKHGAKVLCLDSNGKFIYSRILTYTGYFPYIVGDSLKIEYETAYNLDNNYNSLSISHEHLLFVKKWGHVKFEYIPAYTIAIGDKLLSRDNTEFSVTSITPEYGRIGWFTPLTETGTIVVNDIVASCHTKNNHRAVERFYVLLKLFYWLFPHKDGSPVTSGSHWYSVKFRQSWFGRMIIHCL